MIKKTLTTFECDLCGAEETGEHVQSNLPSGEMGVWAYTDTSLTIGDKPTYCDECISYVRAARDRAIEERRDVNREKAEKSLASRILGR